MKTIEQLLQEAEKATQDEWGYEDPNDACCGFPCTVDGCHESHPTGTYAVYGPSMEDHDLNRMKEADAAHIVQWQPKNIIVFLKAFTAMREALDGTDVEITHQSECHVRYEQECNCGADLSKNMIRDACALADAVLENL